TKVMDGVETRYDAAYGDHERHKLDVYWTDGGKNKPVFIYIPGGGFTGGDKRSDPVFYANIGACMAQEGMVGVVANYRLAPEFQWPAAAKDIESAVTWVRTHAEEFGGDPEKVVIMGHSAGAAHVATFLFDPDIRGETIVKGGLLSSGLYEVPKGTKAPNLLAYFGDDESTFERRSAINHVKESKVPVCLSVAEYDPPGLITPAFDIAKALVARSSLCPPIRCAEGHNHFSTVASMGTSDNDFAQYTIDFVHKCVG
ncbi:MAG: alpha/beta hydrolase, partial [Beijerinckiaceae bacterium]|nr:alpha/beta hydrolase [Beijerinckiaceae bacterium]